VSQKNSLIPSMHHEYLIALGSNLGSRAGDNAQTLDAALQHLTRGGATLRRVSRFFATPCFPPGAGPDYVNACAALRSRDAPDKFLHRLHDAEATFGRTRDLRWASRTLDLDLIAAGNRVLPDDRAQTEWRELGTEAQRRIAPDRLILPHPRLQERGFVLVPLADIAADWVHPILGKNVRQMLAALPGAARDGIVPLGPDHAQEAPL